MNTNAFDESKVRREQGRFATKPHAEADVDLEPGSLGEARATIENEEHLGMFQEDIPAVMEEGYYSRWGAGDISDELEARADAELEAVREMASHPDFGKDFSIQHREAYRQLAAAGAHPDNLKHLTVKNDGTIYFSGHTFRRTSYQGGAWEDTDNYGSISLYLDKNGRRTPEETMQMMVTDAERDMSQDLVKIQTKGVPEGMSLAETRFGSSLVGADRNIVSTAVDTATGQRGWVHSRLEDDGTAVTLGVRGFDGSVGDSDLNALKAAAPEITASSIAAYKADPTNQWRIARNTSTSSKGWRTGR